MKERLLTGAFALAALFCFYVLFLPKPGPAQPQSLPLSTDAGVDGYLAAWRWLAAEHIPVASLRYRYDRLNTAATSASEQGNVLIMTLPQRLPLKLAEWTALAQWLARGNTLLIMAALDDTPQWTLGADSDVLQALRRVGRMEFEVNDDKQSLQQMLDAPPIAFVAQGQHPLLQNVRSLQAISDLPTAHWRAKPLDAALPLALARLASADQSVLWLKRQGRGQLILCAFATPFSNRELTQSDNAVLLSNIIAWSRSESGSVIFDDAHQGLVDFYDAAAFFGDPRLHRSLLWIVLLWLAFVLGPQRLRTAADGWHAVDETALLEAGGRFFSAAVDAADARQALFANFFNVLRRRIGKPEDGEPVWEWLDAQATLSAEQRQELHALYARMCAQQRLDIRRLHNFLSTLQGQLT